jgi:hypothetical protein
VTRLKVRAVPEPSAPVVISTGAFVVAGGFADVVVSAPIAVGSDTISPAAVDGAAGIADVSTAATELEPQCTSCTEMQIAMRHIKGTRSFILRLSILLRRVQTILFLFVSYYYFVRVFRLC